MPYDAPWTTVVPVLEEACREVDRQIRCRPELAHTSHFLVSVDGEVVFDSHYRGPVVADVFSVTKSVVATLAGIAVRDGLLRDLDQPIGELLDVAGSPAEHQTLRQLLTMTRGCEVDGVFEIDEVMAMPEGWIDRIAAAPPVAPPGTTFRYDNGGSHLFGAALARLLGTSLSAYAAERLFAPLGITEWHWPRDPEGFDYGFAHLQLSARSLVALGTLWLNDGAGPAGQLVDAGFTRRMLSAQTAGGPPEDHPYGYLTWVGVHGPFAGGWAGQHVTVVRAARAVIVTTGDPQFDPGPPATDQLREGWRPARDLAVELVVPALLAHGR